jgi:predicted DNA-binding transcriptional regulator AlpA
MWSTGTRQTPPNRPQLLRTTRRVGRCDTPGSRHSGALAAVDHVPPIRRETAPQGGSPPDASTQRRTRTRRGRAGARPPRVATVATSRVHAAGHASTTDPIIGVRTVRRGSCVGPRGDGMSTDERWLGTHEVAATLGVDPSTVRRWRSSRPPQGPPFVKVSPRRTIYSATDVEAWLHSRRVDPAGSP